MVVDSAQMSNDNDEDHEIGHKEKLHVNPPSLSVLLHLLLLPNEKPEGTERFKDDENNLDGVAEVVVVFVDSIVGSSSTAATSSDLES